MKNIYLHIVLLIITGISFSGCSDWLDVDPIDQTKESTQFETEAGIQSVLNGFYRQMNDNSLYGGQLTRTAVEAMANRYVYNTSLAVGGNNGYYARYWSAHEYTNLDIKNSIASIWKNGYTLAFDINNYLKALNESSTNLTESKKDILTGEAYAIRAYIHFDLFRLFGPVYSQSNAVDSIMPYNNLSLTENYEQQMFLLYDQTTPAFMDSVLTDIARAEKRLEKSDPIINNFSSAVTESTANMGENDSENVNYTYDFYNSNRNRRMNYYAVRALKARVLHYMGRTDEAAEIAQSLIDLNKFSWATTPVARLDYTLFSEVLFGIHDLTFYSNAEKWFTVTDIKSGYFVSNLYMNTIYDLSDGGDIRSTFMKNSGINVGSTGPNSSVTTVYYATRYTNKTSDVVSAGLYFQPLIRISEMYYIVAEKYINDGNFTDAASLLNTVLSARGVSTLEQIGGANNTELPDETSYTKDGFIKFLRKEYYREFGGEGQIFFFYKRLNSSEMLDCNTAHFGELLNPNLVYVLPIPDAETDY